MKFHTILKASCASLLVATILPIYAQPDGGGLPESNGLSIDPKIILESIEEKLPVLYQKIAEGVSKKFDFLDLSYSEPSDKNDHSGWVAKYAWDYEKVTHEASMDSGHLTTDDLFFKFEFKGSYARQKTTNLDNMTTSSVSYQRRKADFGELRTDVQGQAYQDCQLQIGPAIDLDNPPDEAGMKALEDNIAKCVFGLEIDRLIDSEEGFTVSVWDIHANIESTQDFTQRQEVYGLSGIYAYEKFPSFRVTLDQVDATENDARKSITDDLKFDRVSAELAYNRALFNLGGNTLRFAASYRYFKELSAPNSAEAAGLDEFDYYSVSLQLPAKALPWFETDDYNIFLRYVDGQLPFDLTPKQGLELGFNTNIKTLANLIGQQ